MTIEQIPIRDRAQWMALRRQDVTASVAGALFGVHEYATRYGLWAEKTGRLPSGDRDSPQLRRGRLLEGVAIEILKEEQPRWNVRRGAHYYRDPDARLGATPDVLISSGNKRGIVQVKTVEASLYRQKWFDEDGEHQVPLWIAVQAIIEAHLTGVSIAYVAPLVVGHGIEMPLIEIPLHAGILSRLRQEVAEFWRMVDAGEEPEPDFARDGATITDVLREGDGTEVDLTWDDRFRDLVERRHALRQRISECKRDLEPIEAEIVHRIGVAERVHLPGWKISRSVVNRRERVFGTVTTTRQLRIKPEGASR